jgi:hypothetical protein
MLGWLVKGRFFVTCVGRLAFEVIERGLWPLGAQLIRTQTMLEQDESEKAMTNLRIEVVEPSGIRGSFKLCEASILGPLNQHG